MEGRAATTEQDLADAVAKIQGEEDAGEIIENVMFKVPESLIEPGRMLTPGPIVDERTFPDLGRGLHSFTFQLNLSRV
jgi:hypothetical protein